MHLSYQNFVFVRTIVQALGTVCIIFFHIFLINEANARAQVKQGLIGTNNFRSFINTVRNYTQTRFGTVTSLIHNGLLLKYVCQKEEYKKEKKEYDADDEDD